MKTKTKVVYRFLICENPFLSDCLECTEDPVFMRDGRYSRYTLIGVPARRVDIAISQSLNGHPYMWEVVDKAGKFDGAVRRRYSVRPCLDARISDGKVIVDKTDRQWVIWSISEGTAPIVDKWERLRSDLDTYKLGCIWSWHYARYYKFLDLSEQEVRTIGDAWAVGKQFASLAEANRSASRDLYRLSRDSGWRKLTLRERLKIGLTAESPQWHRISEMESRLSATGCGEYTILAAKPNGLFNGIR